MSEITYYTKKQKEIEKWISQLGYRVKSEVDVEQYRVDLGIEDIHLAIEIDGPSHKKLKKEGKLINLGNRKDKRDLILLTHYFNGIYHVPVDISEENFKNNFIKIVESLSKNK